MSIRILAAAASLALLAGCASTAHGAIPSSPSVTVTVEKEVTIQTYVTVTPTPKTPGTPKPAPKPKAVIAEGSQVVIGVDVPSGIYDAHSSSSQCYWEIDKHASSDIIDNGGFHTGHLTVKLKAGEDFQTDSCGDWKQE